MSYELRLKLLKEKWMEIQQTRQKKEKLQKKTRQMMKELRSISQKLPKLLDEYNERMV